MDQILEKLKNKQDLTFEESKTAFEILMTGKASDDEIFNFLTLLSEKGEVSDEIAGGVFVLREKSKKIGILKNLPSTFEATRYHSLVIDKKTLSQDLTITAETEDGVIMGVQHKKFNIHGVQFHPESIKTKFGMKILKNFINY